MAFSNPDGRYLTIKSQEGEGWQWQYETLPIDPVLQPEYTMEMNKEMYSEWVDNACTGPMHKQYYHNGTSSYFAQDITLEVNDKATVEFWFRPDVTKQIAVGSVTVLFSMYHELTGREGLVVYVNEGGMLKCAPFGRNAPESTQLVYQLQGILGDDRWHHISCSYHVSRYVTGQTVSYSLSAIENEQ